MKNYTRQDQSYKVNSLTVDKVVDFLLRSGSTPKLSVTYATHSWSSIYALVLTAEASARALGWCACAYVRKHMRVVKMAAIARTVRREKRSSSATKQFQRKSHIFSDLRRQLGM